MATEMKGTKTEEGVNDWKQICVEHLMGDLELYDDDMHYYYLLLFNM